MRDTVFFIILLGFASGIFLRSFFDFGVPVIYGLLLVALALLLARGRSSTTRLPVYLSVTLLALALGVLRLEVASWSEVVPALEAQLGVPDTYTGTVTLEPDVRARTQHLYLDVAGYDTTLLVFADRYLDVSYGDVLEVVGVLERPTAFTTDLGRTFNYPGFLRAKGVEYMVRYPDSLVVVAEHEGNPFVALLLRAKDAFQISLRRFVPSPQVGLAEGLLLGEKQALGDEWNELFRRTGIIHIVVLSGYNVMLVVGFFLLVLSWFGSLRVRVFGALFGIVCFALIVGLSPTVMRASIMASLLLLALLLGRGYVILRALLLAGAIMLLINPYLLLFDPGFQLSFLATLGLIVVAPYFESMIVVSGRAITLRDYVVATVATQIAVLPLLLYQIGELSIVSVLVNVLVLPIVALAMLLTFMTGVVGMVWPLLGTGLGVLTYYSLQYILVIVAFVGSWPLAAVNVPPFPGWVVFAAYGLMGYWWYRRTHTGPASSELFQLTGGVTRDYAPTLEDWEIVEVTETKAGLVRSTSPARERNIFMP